MPQEYKKNYAGRFNLKYTTANLSLAVAAVKRILKINQNTLYVSCMRKITGKNNIYFSFPNILDECEIDYKDVVCSVNKPVDFRRNRLIFPNLHLKYDLN